MKILITNVMFVLILFAGSLYPQDKKVLFEEFTNASCDPCADNNPFLKSYLDSKGDSIVAIKYHTNFPGFDPMYNLNPTQVEERRGGYYSDVNAVPWLKGDGNMFPDIWPFTLANFDAAFNTRKVIIPPLSISVTDTRLPGDSIKSVIYITVTQSLPAGNYKLRVMAVEKVIIYPTPPGSNGERIFEHVFRKGFPDMLGISIPTSTGSYEFIYKYKIEAAWVDTSMYTVAFVQNDNADKEVINCASGKNILSVITTNGFKIPQTFSLHQNYPNPFNPVTSIKFEIPKSEFVRLTIYNSIGKEVEQLTNDFLIPGVYEMKFNASKLTSGIYFYKLEAGSFTEVRKMTLIK